MYKVMPHLSLVLGIQLVGDLNQKFSSGFTRRKIGMCLTDPFGRKRILSMYVDLQGPIRHQTPKLCSVMVAFFECHCVIGYPRTAQRGRVRRYATWETQGTHEGRSSLTFFSTSLNRFTGSTGPDALPNDTMVPLRLIILKSSSNLRSVRTT